ncbi:MAG: hypothetical protein NC313_12170 [Butyrivibrio sp.]|nr:hypothetical protein [Butyrivibrio sp.]
MGKTRVYGLLYDEHYIYLPIKAEFYPNSKGMTKISAYLGLLPNIFGGKVEGRKSIADTLQDEISQESQNKFIINNISLRDENILNHATITYDGDYDEYYFWKVDITGEGNVIPDFGESNNLLLSDETKYPAKCREMKCIIRVPFSSLDSVLTSLTSASDEADEERVTRFLGECGTSYDKSDYFNGRLDNLKKQYGETGDNPYTDWQKSETKKTFVNYLRDLKGIEHPEFTFTAAD